MTIVVGNGAGFLGDDPTAPRRLVDASDPDYLTLEYLAELTMSILARQRARDPRTGFAGDWPAALSSVVHWLRDSAKARIVTNAGGVNPTACGRATAETLVAAGLGEIPIGMVAGDDLLPRIESLCNDGVRFHHLETGVPLSELKAPIVAANAYLGARPIAEALARGARIVVTGRVADASLTVGPAMYEFGWSWTDWSKLAAATVAGHLIECGAQATGGYSTSWSSIDMQNIGYPLAEIGRNGDVTITKPAGSGGQVTRQTIAEQLVYEIEDPARYYTPDVVADFRNVALQQTGADRVAVRGAAGEPAPDQYKVSLAYEDGFMAAGELLVWGEDARAKAMRCAELILHRVAATGFSLERTHVELLGDGCGVPFTRNDDGRDCVRVDDRRDGSRGGIAARVGPSELVLRVAAHDHRRDAIEMFVRQFAPLITSGPAGLAGYAAGRPSVRPVYAYWPTLVPRDLVAEQVEVRTADEWSRH